MDPGVDGDAVAEADRGGVAAAVEDRTSGGPEAHREPAFAPDRGSTVLSLESPQPLGPVAGRSAGIRLPVELYQCGASCVRIRCRIRVTAAAASVTSPTNWARAIVALAASPLSMW